MCVQREGGKLGEGGEPGLSKCGGVKSEMSSSKKKYDSDSFISTVNCLSSLVWSGVKYTLNML